MPRSPARNARPLIVIDAAAHGAQERYERERAAGAVLAVHGGPAWARAEDIVDEAGAAHLALYADEVIGDGLPASVAR